MSSTPIRNPRANPIPGDIFKDTQDGTTIVVLEYTPKLQEVVYAFQKKDNGPWHIGHKSIGQWKLDAEFVTIQRSA